MRRGLGLPIATVLVAPLLLLGCTEPEEPKQDENAEEQGAGARSATPAHQGPEPKPPFQGEAILERWKQRFARVPAGAFDAPDLQLPEEERDRLLDEWFTALESSRRMVKYARRAQETLRAEPAKAVASLKAFLAHPESAVEDHARALSILRGLEHPALTSFCMQQLDHRDRNFRAEVVYCLAASRSRHAIPRMLRRIREFYEEDPEILPQLCLALARRSNLGGLANILAWIRHPEYRERISPIAIEVLALYGDPYVESDGWKGLEDKLRALKERWGREGRVDLAEPLPEAGEEDEYLLDREYWLFFRQFAGRELRPIDEARHIGRNSGLRAVALTREALRSRSLHVRVHALEILQELGRPGKAAEGEVRALLEVPRCRAYALQAYGRIRGEGALEILSDLVRAPAGDEGPSREDRINALHGLSALEDPAALPLLLEGFRSAEDDEMRAWWARALLASARGARAEARGLLEELLEKKRFHGPTLRKILREDGDR